MRETTKETIRQNDKRRKKELTVKQNDKVQVDKTTKDES